MRWRPLAFRQIVEAVRRAPIAPSDELEDTLRALERAFEAEFGTGATSVRAGGDDERVRAVAAQLQREDSVGPRRAGQVLALVLQSSSRGKWHGKRPREAGADKPRVESRSFGDERDYEEPESRP